MSKFKDSMGRYLTLGLFKETNVNEGVLPIYTLLEDDCELISAYKIYMSCNTEYEAAKMLVNSWEHWKKLLNCKPIRQFIDKWREEKEEDLVSRGIKGMLAAISPENKNGVNVSAARWLAERGFKIKQRKTKIKDLENPIEQSLGKDLDKFLGSRQ